MCRFSNEQLTLRLRYAGVLKQAHEDSTLHARIEWKGYCQRQNHVINSIKTTGVW